ncbi:MAG: hypothetical protein ACI8W7_001192 [Gammaproteobacteria bacterium]
MARAVDVAVSTDLRKIVAPTAVALALCVASLLSFYAEPRFDALATKVLDNQDFAHGLQSWMAQGEGVFIRNGEPNTLVIPASMRASYAGRVIAQPGQYAHLRITAQTQSVGLNGTAPWHGGSIALLAYDAAGKRTPHWPQRVIQLHADTPWQRVSAIFPVIPNAKHLFLIASASGPSGFFEVRDFEITALAEKPIFKTLRWALLVAWLTLWLWLVRVLLVKARRSPSRVLAFALANMLLVAGLVPQPFLNDTLKLLLFRSQDVIFASQDVFAALVSASDAVSPTPNGAAEPSVSAAAGQSEAGRHAEKDAKERAKSTQGAQDRARQTLKKRTERESTEVTEPRTGKRHVVRQYWVPHWKDLDKAEHIFGFAMLAFFVGLAYRDRRIVTRLITLAVFATSIQTLQLYVVTREADIGDVRADLLGAVLGTVIATLLLFALRRIVPERGENRREVA